MVVLTYNCVEDLPLRLDGLISQRNVESRIIVVDNASKPANRAAMEETFRQKLSAGIIVEADDATYDLFDTLPETARYLQFSDYERVLPQYLRLYGRERMIIRFQKDLDTQLEAVIEQKICALLGVDEVSPNNVGVRLHQSGDVRFKTLSRLTKSESIARRVLRAFVPRRLHPTLVFWTEMFNIRPVKAEGVPEELRRAHGNFTRRQAALLGREFGLTPLWPSGAGPRPEDT